jgi:hypothetical protein
MGAAHDYILANDQVVKMGYTFADGTTAPPGTQMLASEWLQAALAKVATPMAGSPGAERLVTMDAGENHTSHDLVDRGCTYPNGDFKFCEFATLNKATTHESRVHHVETPGGIQNEPGFVPVDVGFVWITELAYQINQGNTNVTGMSGSVIGNLGIPTPASDSAVNAPNTYSLALLATSDNEDNGNMFIEFLRAPEGQIQYTDGGFAGLSGAELDGGKCYAKPVDGVSVATNRTGPGSCDDWLNNGSF